MAHEHDFPAPNLRSHKVRANLSDDSLLTLAGMAYEAAIDSEQWPRFLTKACQTLAANAGTYHNRNFSQNGLGRLQKFGWDPEKLAQYESFFHTCCLYRENIPRTVVGSSLSITAFLDSSSYTHSLYYNDFLKPQDIHHTCFVNLQSTSGGMATFDLYRPAHREDFDATERLFVEKLSGHLKRATRISETLEASCLKADAYLEALKRSPLPTLLLNRSGKVAYTNTAFENFLAERSGVSIQNDRLVLASPNASRTYLRILAKLTGDSAPACSDEVVEVDRPSCEANYTLKISNTEFRTSIGEEGFITVFVNVAPHLPENLEERLISTFGLTPAEARLASGLATGRKLQQLAKDFGITYETARTQLKRVFEKTDTHSQAHLINSITIRFYGNC